MIDTKQLVEYAKHPELALQNLAELLSMLESPDENAQNFVTEALENCGQPAKDQIGFLLKQLASPNSTRVYWSATLLGRLGESFPPQTRENLVEELCNVVCDSRMDLAARERAAWALGELKSLSEPCRSRLAHQSSQSPARLKRLIDTALSN